MSKPISNELRALLATRQFYVADLYTFSGGLLAPNVLRYCAGDRDISANGFLYTAGGLAGPYFDRRDNKAKCHWKLGVEVDTLIFDVLPGTATVLDEPFLQAVHAGQFDGAELLLERAYMPVYGDVSRGTVIMFVGRVAEIDAGRSIATFTINSHLELLNLMMPRNLFQAPCVNNLGDAACGVNLSSYAINGAVNVGGSSQTIIGGSTVTGVLTTPGYFILGKLVFTSGKNNGLARTVTFYNSSVGAFIVLNPFPTAPANGDTFTVYPGCDKTLDADGCPKFNNQARFKGEPYTPVPETAV